MTQKLDKVTEQKIETINVEKDEMNAKFENHKMITLRIRLKNLTECDTETR